MMTAMRGRLAAVTGRAPVRAAWTNHPRCIPVLKSSKEAYQLLLYQGFASPFRYLLPA